MTRASPMLPAFNAGEFSVLMDGRVDLQKYPYGCKRMEGFIPTLQGPAVRRGGTRYVKPTKVQADRSWLIKFEFSATQCYHLEFGNFYVRFYTLHGQLLSGSTPYEIASPYALADLTNADGSCALSVVQSGDVLYITNAYRTYPTQKLIRLGNANWVFSVYQPSNGPFLEQNITTTTIYVDAQTGAGHAIASAAVFAPTDVGRLIRVDVQNQDVKPWETDKGYAINDLVRFDGKTYKALTADDSGTSPPVQESGTAFDGKDGVQWEFQDAGYGVARISGYVSPTDVTYVVVVDAANGLRQFPAAVVGSGNKTTRWQLGAWSATTEYPATACFFRNRLFLAGKQRVWGSVPDDFENQAPDFFGLVRNDNAISRVIASQDVNDILWMIEGDLLVIGTGGGEFVGGEVTSTSAVGPDNFKISKQSKKRCRGVAPVYVGNSVLYTQRSGRKVLSLNYSFDTDKFVSTDLTVLSNRIAREGVIGLAYQGEPYSIVWCLTATGKLVGLTYDQDQQVQAWHRQPIGGAGFVESISVGPTPDGSREELWMIVRRVINGQIVRYVEFMEKPWEGPDEDGTIIEDQADAFYVDSGLTYEGAPVTVLTGLAHLEGQTVQVWADGAVQPDKVVSGGQITLTRAASVVQVGLYYTTRLVPMRPEAGSQTGTAQGKTKRLDQLVARFIDTVGGKCGRYGETLDSISRRAVATPMGQATPAFSGDVPIDFPGDYDRDGLVEIMQDQPAPMTLAALIPLMKTYDR